MLEFRELARRDRRRLVNEVQLLEEIPSSYLEDANNCPYTLDGSCEGVKDADSKERCFGDNFSYRNCRIFQLRLESPDSYDNAIPISDSLEDTVIISGDRIVHSNSSYDDSVHDQIADGKPIEEFFGIRKTLRTFLIDSRADF